MAGVSGNVEDRLTRSQFQIENPPPFGLTDFKDLKWFPLEELPKPLGVPQALVKAASRLTPGA